MNKLTHALLLICLLLSVQLFADGPEGHDIKIKVNGFKEGSTCILGNYYGDKQYISDSAKVDANGEMQFKGTNKYPQGIYFILAPNKDHFDIIMDAPQHFSIETDTLDFINKMSAKGSDENASLIAYQKFIYKQQKLIEPLRELIKTTKDKDSIKRLTENMTTIDQAVKEYKDNFIKDHSTSFVAKLLKATEEIEVPDAPILPNGKKDSLFQFRYYKTHFFDNIDFTDERMLRTPVFHPKIQQYLDNMTSPFPDSISVSADYLIEKARNNQEIFKYMVYWLTYHYESSKIMGQDAIFVHLVKKYYITHQAYWVDSAQLEKINQRALTLEPILIGKKAPPISMLDSINRPVSLYDIKAPYTVLIFWDADCGHCQKEVPKLKELYEHKLKAMGIGVFAVATEEKPAAWKKFILEHKLNWTNVHQPDDYKRAVIKHIYDIQSTPFIYLLDENKTIKAKHFDVEQLGPLLDALEKEKKAKRK